MNFRKHCVVASLMKFLLRLGIIEEGNMNNELYGNVMALITNVSIEHEETMFYVLRIC